MNLYIVCLIASLVINLVMFVPAFIFQTDKLTDISYAVSFIVLAIFGFFQSNGSTLHALVSACIVLWGLRLGTFLFVRISYMKRDKRFDGMREYFFKFLRFWVLQGVTVAVVSMSAITLWKIDTPKPDAFTFAGLAVFLIGLLIEGFADLQKFQFSKDPENKNKWITSGLWGKSRHPNYLGEMMVWIGLYIVVAGQLSGWDLAYAAVSPLFIMMLLLFVSGIPLLEKSADARWGSDKKYQEYKKSTPVLLPRFW